MTNVGGINPAPGPAPIQPNPSAKPPKTEPARQQDDTVEISFLAQIRGKLAEVAPIRSDLVASVKAEILAGTYETPEKMDAAITSMLDET